MKTKPKPGQAEGPSGPRAEDAEHPFARRARTEADPAQHFAAAVEALDPNHILPRDERKRVVDYLVVAADGYMLRQSVEAGRPSPSEQLLAHKRIAAAARLLKALGIDDPASLASGWPTLPPPGSSKRKLLAHFKRTAGQLPPMAALQRPTGYGPTLTGFVRACLQVIDPALT
jgi:hypothetical protein